MKVYKGYNVGMLGTFSMVQITSRGQGFAPKPLQGLYTNTLAAHKAIDVYLEGLKKGRKKNVKTKDASTG